MLCLPGYFSVCDRVDSRVPVFAGYFVFLKSYYLFIFSFSHLTMLSCVQVFATPWTVVPQAPVSMGFSKQEYWSVLPFPPPRNLPEPGMELASTTFPVSAGGFFTTVSPGKPILILLIKKKKKSFIILSS